jgi:ferritin-like metal-binding protein YciE
MPMESLQDVLIEGLKDLYGAEKQIAKALPRMAKAASSEELRSAFEEHVEVTHQQVQRLEQVFEHLDVKPRAKRCAAMEGLLEEGKEIIDQKKESEPSAIDAALIIAAQKVEHYEISGYGSVRTLAQTLGLEEAARLLQATLDEESATNEKLSDVATRVNSEAMEAGEAGEMEAEEEEDEADDEDEEAEMTDVEEEDETADDQSRGGSGPGRGRNTGGSRGGGKRGRGR